MPAKPANRSPVFAPTDTAAAVEDRRRKALAAVADAPPQQSVTVFNIQTVPPAVAQDVDAERILQIFRSLEAGQNEDYLALCRDLLFTVDLLTPWMQRKTRLLSKDPSRVIRSEDATDPRAARNDKFCAAMVKGCRGWMTSITHLLDGSLYPVAVVEKVYTRATEPSVRWKLAELVPVSHHLLDFRDGLTRVRETDEAGNFTGQLLPLDPMRYIVHRGHLLQSLPDYWGGPIRAGIFWAFFQNIARAIWMRRLERHQVPFLIGKYDPANPGDRSALLAAFSATASQFGLAVSRDTEVQVQNSLAGGDDTEAFEKFFRLCGDQLAKLVAGQTMTSDAKASGFGSNQASVHDDVLTDAAAFDGVMLAATLADQLFTPLMALNALDGPVPEISWPVATEDQQARASLLETLGKAGIRPTPDAAPQLSEAFGLPVTMEPPPSPVAPGVAALSASLPVSPLDAIPRAAAADLARAFSGTLAPVRAAIAASKSPADLQARLAALYSDWTPGRIATLVEDACNAAAAAGCAGFRV